MARERYLFRADLEGYTYRQILEVRPGSVRLLRPSESRKRLSRWISTLLALGFIFVFGFFLNGALAARLVASGNSGLGGLVVAAALISSYFAGLIVLLLWWDERNLPLLAENPDFSMAVDALGATSFGTFQEIRARAGGQEVRISVHGSKARVGEALRFAGLAVPFT